MLNEQTFEFSQARLRLKDSLRFTMRQNGKAIEYLVEDEVTGRFFRVGLPQYTFLTMLDGRRTVSTALMKTASLLREHAIDETEAASLCKWAIESGTGRVGDRQLNSASVGTARTTTKTTDGFVSQPNDDADTAVQSRSVHHTHHTFYRIPR